MIYRLLRVVAAFILTFNIAALIWVLIYAWIPIPITKLMVIEGESKEIKYQWRSLEQISDKLQLAVMCSEDQSFLLHNGLDFHAIRQVEESNKKGGSLRGASTITQQVAKNVFLWPDRSWTRKASELYFALLIDALWSKQRIMEVYLNVAEMGDGIFGAEVAAQTYFNKPAADLSIHESAQIVVTLPNPKAYSATNPTSYLRNRASWLREQMWYWGNEMTYDPAFVLKMIQ